MVFDEVTVWLKKVVVVEVVEEVTALITNFTRTVTRAGEL